MSVRVALPPGCYGLTYSDGSKTPEVRPGGTVTVPDHRAAEIERRYGGDGGLVQAQHRVFTGGPKRGRWCYSCQPARLWHNWTTECPKCHMPTEPEVPPDAAPGS